MSVQCECAEPPHNQGTVCAEAWGQGHDLKTEVIWYGWNAGARYGKIECTIGRACS